MNKKALIALGGLVTMTYLAVSVAMHRTPTEVAVSTPAAVETPVAAPTPVATEDFSHLQSIIDQGGDEGYTETGDDVDYWEFEQLRETYDRRLHELNFFEKSVAEAKEVDKAGIRQKAQIIIDACWEVASDYNMRARGIDPDILEQNNYKESLDTELCNFRE